MTGPRKSFVTPLRPLTLHLHSTLTPHSTLTMLFRQWINLLQGSRGFNKSSRSVVPVLSKCSSSSDCDDSYRYSDIGNTETDRLADEGLECDYETILEDVSRVALCDGLLTARGTTLPSTWSTWRHGQELLAAEDDSDAAAADQPEETIEWFEMVGMEEEGESTGREESEGSEADITKQSHITRHGQEVLAAEADSDAAAADEPEETIEWIEVMGMEEEGDSNGREQSEGSEADITKQSHITKQTLR